MCLTHIGAVEEDGHSRHSCTYRRLLPALYLRRQVLSLATDFVIVAYLQADYSRRTEASYLEDPAQGGRQRPRCHRILLPHHLAINNYKVIWRHEVALH